MNMCPCENSTCSHKAGHCDREINPQYVMLFLGEVCKECGEQMVKDAPQYMMAPIGTAKEYIG